MFLIMGINTKEKRLKEFTLICPNCESFGRFKVVESYQCFNLFFIDILKWNVKYTVMSNCCGSIYMLKDEIAYKIKHDENYHLAPDDLSLVMKSNLHKCPQCQRMINVNNAYCSHCGNKII